ncbi:hypothetical protein BT96DRAFT_662460 [Gymnopus androsaceus JB14]|uniref:U3 small nucleolar RNA-associated protein 6 N-terminal domain-containing protein n=1 Tax=Gymnopus androsaceus JB14 TaxID=1447944 RepID=A0A6A4I902_9AGAR|nr:hypothetical protein BT96DRAFT_662460 [Gymnopus androsaceus JB14]
MERVQFQQEQMLDELKDLVEKKVFTVAETKQIMKQRSTFEATLVRRVAKKSDFLRYASYEMGLEHLRRKRVDRLNIPKTPVTVSDFALVRRQFHIFERALKRFKSDVGLWIEYIQVAKKEGARSLVGRITARALQLHPNVPALYILAASHELDHLSPSTARTLLQRGIRLNSDSVEMWVEYVKMELGFVESLRRRWQVLGINGGSGSQKETGENASEKDRHLDVDLFESLNQLITTYPSSPILRESLITHLDALLRLTLPRHPRAITILYTRLLTSTAPPEASSSSANVLRGQALIEGIRRANEMLISVVSEAKEEPVRKVYAEFALKWCCVINLDENLKLYVLSSLQALIRREKDSVSLLCAHIKLLTEAAQRGTVESTKALGTARRYTARVPESGSVWVARLGAVEEVEPERRHG